jgi:peptidoglycan-associated lipoprotein
MRSKTFSIAITIALMGTLSFTTGCKNGRWFWQKPKPGTTTPAPLGDGTGITGSERPMMTGDLQHGEFGTVYFDYDSSKVRPSEMSKLEAVATALKGNNKKLVIEGYADERGTPEYNRTLGERRALSCREELTHLGIAADRMTTVSYGKARPADLGHDEAAWAKNRRCEFVSVSQ